MRRQRGAGLIRGPSAAGSSSAVFAAQLELVRKKEAEAEARVKGGEKLKFWDPAALGDRVRYID